MYAQASPSRFQTEISPCLPKCNPDPEFELSPPAPHPTLGRWPLPEEARESFHKYVSNRFYLVNFHFGKDPGAKLWPEMPALVRSLKKKETMNLIFAVKYVASLRLSLPSSLP